MSASISSQPSRLCRRAGRRAGPARAPDAMDGHPSVRGLPPSVAARVRGEVTIPTFARAVEEIVLNSLDAGASEIVATIDMPGRSFSVRDNGHGMNRAALCTVGEGQSTSRLQTVEQLNAGVRTFGFRGEALAALSAVALVEIVSRPCAPAGAPTLSTILRLGHRESFGAASEARAPGTTVSVRDLFCNRAVARKQLQRASSSRAEASSLLARLTRLAVAHPNVAFRLYDSARAATLLSKGRSASCLSAFRQLLGEDHTLSMYDVRLDAAGYSVRGHLTSPPDGSRSREMQLICVNNRPLSRRSELHKLVEAAYMKVQTASEGGGAAHGAVRARPVSTAPLHPAFLLFIHCSPSCYDVSLDVDKCDVLFIDSLAVRRAVIGALTRFFSAGAPENEAQGIRTSLGLLATGKRESSTALRARAHGGPACPVETFMDGAIGALSGNCASLGGCGCAPTDEGGTRTSHDHVGSHERTPRSCGLHSNSAADGLGELSVQDQAAMMTSSLSPSPRTYASHEAGDPLSRSTAPRTAIPPAIRPNRPPGTGCIGDVSPPLPENWLASPCGSDPVGSPCTDALASPASNFGAESRPSQRHVAVRGPLSFSGLETTHAAANAKRHSDSASLGRSAGAPFDEAAQRAERPVPNEVCELGATVAQVAGVRGLRGPDPLGVNECIGLDFTSTASDIASRLASAAYDDAPIDAPRPLKRLRRSVPMRLAASTTSIPLGSVPNANHIVGATMVSAAHPPSSVSETVSKGELRRLRAIGQIERRFIAARAVRPGGGGTRLILVDQHAADERVQLERLQAATVLPSGLPVPGAIVRRALRPPTSLHVAQHEWLLLDRFLARLAAWGWTLELIGGVEEHIVLHSVPTVHGVGLSWAGAVEYLHVLEESAGGSTQPPPAVTRLLASKACRSAVMFGDVLSRADSQAVLCALAECKLPFQCAHGRPTIAPMLWLQ